MTGQSFIDCEGKPRPFSGAVITVTTASELDKEVSKMIRDGKINSIEYVTTAPSSPNSIELHLRDEPEFVEETEVTKAKIEVKKKIDNKNWLKASDKPWERNKKGVFK